MSNTRTPQTGGLHLPPDVGLGQQAAAAIANEWDTIAGVDERLRQQGFHANPEPDVVCPIVTTEALVNPDIKEFTTTFAAQLRWYNYVTRLHADVRAQLLQVTNEMDDITAKRRAYFREAGKKMNAAEMEDRIRLDPRMHELTVLKQQLDQHRIKLDAWSDTLERNLKTVSRQIENRKTESSGGNREGNMPAHAGQGRPGQWGGR